MVTKCSLRGTENHQQKEPLNITNTHTHIYHLQIQAINIYTTEIHMHTFS